MQKTKTQTPALASTYSLFLSSTASTSLLYFQTDSCREQSETERVREGEGAKRRNRESALGFVAPCPTLQCWPCPAVPGVVTKLLAAFGHTCRVDELPGHGPQHIECMTVYDVRPARALDFITATTTAKNRNMTITTTTAPRKNVKWRFKRY